MTNEEKTFKMELTKEQVQWVIDHNKTMAELEQLREDSVSLDFARQARREMYERLLELVGLEKGELRTRADFLKRDDELWRLLNEAFPKDHNNEQ